MIDTSFLECSDYCALKPPTIVGYPLYAFNHQGCALGSASEPGTLACPIACTRPTQADRGTNAVLTGSLPFMPGPAMALRRTFLGQDTRFITIKPVEQQATCTPSFDGLTFQVYGPSDGGAMVTGVFPISNRATNTDNNASVVLDSSTATAGSLTLTSLSPVTGTFTITGFSRDAGPLQGSFTATTCP